MWRLCVSAGGADDEPGGGSRAPTPADAGAGMMWNALKAALTTGAFCALFAGGVDAATDMLTTRNVMIVGGISGFLGSLFATFVWRRNR